VQRELSASADDLALLRSFYDHLYVNEFRDPDERESLANMRRYLELKAQGWYGANDLWTRYRSRRGARRYVLSVGLAPHPENSQPPPKHEASAPR